MKTVILLLVSVAGFVNGGCKFPRQLRGSTLTFMVDQTATGNKRISSGKFAIDSINRRAFVKTRDRTGYTQVLEFYNQKRIYYVGPKGICHSFPLTDKFPDFGVPHGAHLFGQGQVRRQGSEPRMDLYGYETSQNHGVVKLKEYHITKVTTEECLPVSTATYTDAGPWYKSVHISHFYNLSLGVQPDDFKVPRSCRFRKSNMQSSADSLPLSRGLKPPPFRIVGDAGGDYERLLRPPIRILGDAGKMSRNKILFGSNPSNPQIRVLSDNGNGKRATQSRELYSRFKILDDGKNFYDQKLPSSRLQPAPVKNVGDQGQIFQNEKSLRSYQPKLPFKLSSKDDLKGSEEKTYFESIKDSPPIRILG